MNFNFIIFVACATIKKEKEEKERKIASPTGAGNKTMSKLLKR